MSCRGGFRPSATPLPFWLISISDLALPVIEGKSSVTKDKKVGRGALKPVLNVAIQIDKCRHQVERTFEFWHAYQKIESLVEDMRGEASQEKHGPTDDLPYDEHAEDATVGLQNREIKPQPQEEQDRLFQENGKSKYVNNSFWAKV